MNVQLVGLVIDTGGALLMLLLALGVWRVRPGSRLNRTFAQLVSAIAVAVLFLNLGWLAHYTGGERLPGRSLYAAAGGLFLLVATYLIILLERQVPQPSAVEHRPFMRILSYVLPVVLVAAATPDLVRTTGMIVDQGGDMAGPSAFVNGTGLILFTAATLFLLVRLAGRYVRSGESEDPYRWQAATVAMAIGAFPLYAAATGAIEPPIDGASSTIFSGLILIPLSLAALVWIWAGTRSHGRLAMVTGLILLTVVFVGMAAASRYGAITAVNSGVLGILRLAGTGLLAYTIVRHQLFDIELKVKWTISRGTVAGIFVATFFIVSELTAALLSERMSPVIGILLTGVLVFALAPLQRFGDHLSDVALPHVADTPAYREERRREIYISAIRSALTDGIVTDRERNVLATLADQLGLTSMEALELERTAMSAR